MDIQRGDQKAKNEKAYSKTVTAFFLQNRFDPAQSEKENADQIIGEEAAQIWFGNDRALIVCCQLPVIIGDDADIGELRLDPEGLQKELIKSKHKILGLKGFVDHIVVVQVVGSPEIQRVSETDIIVIQEPHVDQQKGKNDAQSGLHPTVSAIQTLPAISHPF